MWYRSEKDFHHTDVEKILYYNRVQTHTLVIITQKKNGKIFFITFFFFYFFWLDVYCLDICECGGGGSVSIYCGGYITSTMNLFEFSFFFCFLLL